MIFDALVVGYVRANFARALASIVAIALGVGTAVVLWVASGATVANLSANRDLFAPSADLRVLPYAGALDERLLPAVRYLEGVASALPEIERPIDAGVDSRGAGGVAAQLLGTDLLQALPGVTNFEESRPGPFASSGTFLNPSEVLGTDGAIVSARLAQRLGLHRGAALAVLAGSRVATLRIANVLPADVTGIDANVVFVDYTTAQRLFDLPHGLDRIDLRAAAPLAAVHARVAAALGGRARLTLPGGDGFALGDLSEGVAATFGALAAIALAVGGLLVWSTVGTSVALRRGDIGTLRALGVAPHQIAAAFVCEGAGYGVAGAFFGSGLAAIALQAIAARSNLAFAQSPVGPSFVAAALGIAIAIVAALGPALAAARTAPALAAKSGRFEARAPWTRDGALALAAVASFGAAIVLGAHPSHAARFVLGLPATFVLGAALAAPALVRLVGLLALRAGSRSGATASAYLAAHTLAAMPRRVTIALIALAIAVCAATSFDIASTSFERALGASIARTIAGDFIVTPAAATFDAMALVRARATPGVAHAEGLRTIYARTLGADVAVRGEDDFAPAPHYAATPAPEAPEAPEAPAALSAQLATHLGVARGDTLDLRTPRGSLRVRIVDVHPDFTGDRAIVVARRLLGARFGDDRIDTLRVSVARGADLDTVRTAVVHALAPLRAVAVSTRDLRRQISDTFAATFAFARSLGGVVIAIAVAGVASGLGAFVLERADDLRTLRRLGARRRTIARSLMLEALAIATAGCLFGTILGIGFAAIQLGESDPVALGFAIVPAIPFERIALELIAAIAAIVAWSAFSAPFASAIASDVREPAS